MAYLGKKPSDLFRASASYDSFTGDGSTTAFDLTYEAGSANDIIVVVNNVRQEPGSTKSYTLGLDGSNARKRVNFVTAPAASDAIYVINPTRPESHLFASSVRASAITNETELAETAADGDYMLVYDTSASTLKKIQVSNLGTFLPDAIDVNASAAADSLTIDASGNTTFTPATQLSHRNLIINGSMQVAQRGTQTTGITGASYNTVDRFKTNVGSLGTWTNDQSTDAPNGFSNSFKLTCTTADASPAAGDYLRIQYRVEAQDLQCLGYGTSDAKASTLSFWVKSNKTGSASINIKQPDNSSKMLSPSYTISSADTWEKKTISIPADTSGVINNDNGEGFRIDWTLNSGSDRTSGTNNTTWTTYSEPDENPSNLGVGGATSDYFAITGVQLEVGSVATPFEHRSYGEELARCQRYYHQTGTDHWYCYLYRGDNRQMATVNYPTTMRTEPTVTNTWNDDGGVGESAGSPVAGVNWCRFVSAGANANNIQPSVSDLTFDAEL